MAENRVSPLAPVRRLLMGRPLRQQRPDASRKGMVFVHVPKCAGMSVEKALKRLYPLSMRVVCPDRSFETARRRLQRQVNDETRHAVLCEASEIRRTVLEYDLASGFSCIAGHAPLGKTTLDAHADSHAFVTVLRDPVERYVSHMAYNFSDLGGHGRVEESVDAFLERPRARMMGALYIKYFAGMAMTNTIFEKPEIEAAKASLARMTAVGFTDRINDFGGMIGDIAGKRVEIGHQNRGPGQKPLILTEAQMARVNEICTPDIAVYEWAKARFLP